MIELLPPSTPPKMTVGLPLYRGADIAWLALDGLCRQARPDVPWELIVSEEVDAEPLGVDELAEWAPHLQRVGCSRVAYDPVDAWIPLSLKWRRIGATAHLESTIFLLQGGDDAPDPERLVQAHRAFSEVPELDWLHYPRGYFYDIGVGTLGVFDQSNDPAYAKNGVRTLLSMATRTEWMRRLPDETVRQGVDGWILHSIQRLKGDAPLALACASPDLGQSALYTDGANTLSQHRAGMILGSQGPFHPVVNLTLEDIVPVNVAVELRDMRMQALLRSSARDARSAIGTAAACSLTAGLRQLVWGR